MRKFVVLAGTALLGACGGGAVTSTPTPPSGGGTGSTPGSTHTFVNPTEVKTYVGVGGSQVYEYSTDDRACCDQQQQIYSGNTGTVRSSGISIAYDPSSAVFTLKVQDAKTGASADVRFQDPASRTDFGGTVEPQWGTQNLNNANFRYLQAGDGDPRSPYSSSGSGTVDKGTNSLAPLGTDGSSYQATSLTYLKPGTVTNYVSLAAYARNSLSWSKVKLGGTDSFQTKWHLERGAFAFGELTGTGSVPKTGTGTYNGLMLGTMVFNPTLDGQDQSGTAILASYFQWLSGTSKLDVNFGSSTFTMALNGNVFAPQLDYDVNPAAQDTVLKAGATFTAAGKGTINLVNFGGFKGTFDSASFTNPGVGGSVYNVAIAGSSIDGAFYGPNGEEAGGGFHIVGANADERIDILGAFVGKK